MNGKVKTKTVHHFKLHVTVTAGDIQGSRCRDIARCMEKVAIQRALFELDPDTADHKVRVDAGHVKFTLHGYRWKADLPKSGRRNLIAFDNEELTRIRCERTGADFVSKVKPHSYTLTCVRTTVVAPKVTRERQDQINAARRERSKITPDRSYVSLRKRVAGLGRM